MSDLVKKFESLSPLRQSLLMANHHFDVTKQLYQDDLRLKYIEFPEPDEVIKAISWQSMFLKFISEERR